MISLLDKVPSTDKSSVETYVKIVKEKAERRRQIAALEKALSDMYDPKNSINDVDDNICSVIFNSPDAKQNDMRSFEDCFFEFMDEYDERKRLGKKLPGISTGYKKLDIMTGGLEKEDVYYRRSSGHGKNGVRAQYRGEYREARQKSRLIQLGDGRI